MISSGPSQPLQLCDSVISATLKHPRFLSQDRGFSSLSELCLQFFHTDALLHQATRALSTHCYVLKPMYILISEDTIYKKQLGFIFFFFH